MADRCKLCYSNFDEDLKPIKAARGYVCSDCWLTDFSKGWKKRAAIEAKKLLDQGKDIRYMLSTLAVRTHAPSRQALTNELVHLGLISPERLETTEYN